MEDAYDSLQRRNGLMNTMLNYLYDPLCGWCYGATNAVSAALAVPGVTVTLLPTGLFSGAGARAMDDDFASYAWSNDQRIGELTGQGFTQQYRQQVLADRGQRFDSGPATMALTAVHSTAPAREFDALKAIQRSRYVDGADITSLATLARLLEGLDLREAASMLTDPKTALLAQARIDQVRVLMREFGLRGVPGFIAESPEKRWVLNPNAAYADPSALVDQLEKPDLR